METGRLDPRDDTMDPGRLARAAGALYLVIFVVAPFAFVFGREGIHVAGDALATAGNLAADESRFRIGMAAETVVFLVEIVLAALLYGLLRPVSRSLSMAASFSRLGEAVLQAVNLLTGALALFLVTDSAYAAIDAEQRDALGLLFLDANELVILVWGLFFGLHLLLVGVLVHRSGFLPRSLGVLLGIASVGYLAESYGSLLWPESSGPLAAVVVILAVPGELAFALWLLIKGVDVDAWRARAATDIAGPAVDRREPVPAI